MWIIHSGQKRFVNFAKKDLSTTLVDNRPIWYFSFCCKITEKCCLNCKKNVVYSISKALFMLKSRKVRQLIRNECKARVLFITFIYIGQFQAHWNWLNNDNVQHSWLYFFFTHSITLRCIFYCWTSNYWWPHSFLTESENRWTDS